MARMANALTRPGIDPRVWISYGVLTSEPYIETQEGQQDVFVNVMLMPSGENETARVGAIYAGNGFGLYAPLHENDEVLVLAPSGDPDEGLVIAQRLWSAADPPPDEITLHPDDLTLVVEEDKNLRLKVMGAGDVIISADAGKVRLGGEAAEKGVARLDDTVAAGDTPVTGMATWIGLVSAAINVLAPGSIPSGVPSDFGKINSASTKVVSE